MRKRELACLSSVGAGTAVVVVAVAVVVAAVAVDSESEKCELKMEREVRVDSEQRCSLFDCPNGFGCDCFVWFVVCLFHRCYFFCSPQT